jgi:hypothetical protein
MALYTNILSSVDTTPKEMLPPHKRLTKGAQQMSDPSQPQCGDMIVVHFAGTKHTGVVVKAVITEDGRALYSVNYKSGLFTRDDILDGYKWRFHSSSPKAPKSERKARPKWDGPAVSTGRIRKGVTLFKAESATAANKGLLHRNSPGKKKKGAPIAVCVDSDSDCEVVEAYEVVAESDDDVEYVECEVFGM